MQEGRSRTGACPSPPPSTSAPPSTPGTGPMAPSTGGALSWLVITCKVIQVPGVQELSEATALPVERVQAEVLMVVGEDDHNWDSAM